MVDMQTQIYRLGYYKKIPNRCEPRSEILKPRMQRGTVDGGPGRAFRLGSVRWGERSRLSVHRDCCSDGTLSYPSCDWVTGKCGPGVVR